MRYAIIFGWMKNKHGSILISYCPFSRKTLKKKIQKYEIVLHKLFKIYNLHAVLNFFQNSKNYSLLSPSSHSHRLFTVQGSVLENKHRFNLWSHSFIWSDLCWMLNAIHFVLCSIEKYCIRKINSFLHFFVKGQFVCTVYHLTDKI